MPDEPDQTTDDALLLRSADEGANPPTASPADATGHSAVPPHPPTGGAAPTEPEHPPYIGRYRVDRLLGAGSFGRVYLAHDEQLHRPVAIKVPHAHLVARAADAEAYLAEARTVAGLDHPNIVPVHDVGGMAEYPVFVVSKFIDGGDLAARMRRSALSVSEAAGLLATLAEALHHAHRHGIVHRDVKPANIFIDREGRPFVGDFGLALREQDVGTGPRFAGTPAYMSPEQARGEGHRVDARSDVFSLGVVFYELLTGRRPFRGKTQHEVLEQITGVEARPPRQIDDRIPKELDRICLKALSQRASDRFSTARDLADDLRLFLSEAPPAPGPAPVDKVRGQPPAVAPTPGPAPSSTDSRSAEVVPKGLRSFDAADADFFLELLPGPHDREGLPDSIRFWKGRVETTDSDGTFAVGLIYGPSGCGKSSLVKAGLLPRLAASVTPVYVESTGEETEARLLKGLRRQVPGLPTDLSLPESLAALRRGRFVGPGRKVLLVLDQFEQWLHGKRGEANAELVQALRQCDGGRLQAVVMVRDDFWLAVSRFMQALEVPVLEGENSRLVDLFDPLHARKVLSAFGRAYGRLPENLGQCSTEQEAFLDRAVSELAEEGKVISVRLALFAEMVKGRPWTPGTLKEVGGTAGVGVTFLEETFAASTAPPSHRLHQKAAQAVLRGLLPEAGTDMKGHMRSRRELLEASGYASRPKDFADLLRVLDGELRLITPTDPEGKDEAGTVGAEGGGQYYQLTHDYLVPSLRDWLTRKQKETRRGRAELLLADRAAVWAGRPENRQLPSLAQWARIRWLVPAKNRTPPQRAMMRRAARYHAVRGVTLAALLAVLACGGYEGFGRLQARALRDRLLNASTAEVPAVVADMPPYRRWLDPLLRESYARAEAASDVRKQLHLSLALLPGDAAQVDYLSGRLLAAEPNEVPVIRDALAPHRDRLLDQLWAVAEAPDKGKEAQRLRAAAALARYAPDASHWAEVQDAVATDLVRVPAVYLSAWLEALRPVREKLAAPLSAVYRDPGRRDVERYLATDILADYASDRPDLLADLLLDADDKQFAAIFPRLSSHGDRGMSPLTAEVDRTLPTSATNNAKEKLAKRQANAVVGLLRMDRQERLWPMLKHGPDPRVRSYLIHRLCPLGADPSVIIRRLQGETEPAVRRALILSLGEFGDKELAPEDRKALGLPLQEFYRKDPDPGLHAAVEWLLRTWGNEDWLSQVNNAWSANGKQREERLGAIGQMLSENHDKARPMWYVTGQGQTMVVVPGPAEFLMGSPETEADRRDDERLHRRRIVRTFALAAKPVSLEQFRRFAKAPQLAPVYTRRADLPVVEISWYEAAAYCNWLSGKEGIPKDQWCYETNAKGEVNRLKAGCLALKGYRLPTEAETEYATRAGASTSRFFGETDELMPKYAWYARVSKEQTWPPGSTKPNDLGVFDTGGNVITWCQDAYKSYPDSNGLDAVPDEEGGLEIVPEQTRVLRGASINSAAAFVRSACRRYYVPSLRDDDVGFRVAKTVGP